MSYRSDTGIEALNSSSKLIKLNYCTGWTAVERGSRVNYDLEINPIYVKTDSVEGSKDKIELNLYSNGEPAGGIRIYFRSPPKYNFAHCTAVKPISTTVPSATNKVWKITLTRNLGIRIVINCNNVEVLNVLVSDSTCSSNSGWANYWTRDVDKIQFSPSDTASDFCSSHLTITRGESSSLVSTFIKNRSY